MAFKGSEKMEGCVENPVDICRLCALDSESGVHIYSAEGESNLMEQKILTCLRIQVDRSDPLSKSVCPMCNMLLEELHQFCCRAASAQETLAYLLDMDKNDEKQFKAEGNFIKNELEESALLSSIGDNDNLTSEFVGFDEASDLYSQLPDFYEESRTTTPIISNAPTNPEIQALEQTTNSIEASSKEVTGTSKDVVPASDVLESKLSSKKHNLDTKRPRPLKLGDSRELHSVGQPSSSEPGLKKKYPCTFCEKKFTLKRSLRAHAIAFHSTRSSFTCQSCGKPFLTQSRLDKHSQVHDERPRRYSCLECGKILQTRSGLRRHRVTHRNGRSFQCHLCGKTFTQKANLDCHALSHQGEKPFSCDQCDKSFSRKSHLTRHIFGFHAQDRCFECPKCKKSFKTDRCVKMHMKTHNSAMPFVCDECGKLFRNISKLKLHLKGHFSDKPYPCGRCDKKFNDPSNATKHKSRCHRLVSTLGASFKEEFEMQSLIGLPLQSLEPDLLQLSNFKEENEALFLDPASASAMKTHDSFISITSGDLSISDLGYVFD